MYVRTRSALRSTVTLPDAPGNEICTHTQPFNLSIRCWAILSSFFIGLFSRHVRLNSLEQTKTSIAWKWLVNRHALQFSASGTEDLSDGSKKSLRSKKPVQINVVKDEVKRNISTCQWETAINDTFCNWGQVQWAAIHLRNKVACTKIQDTQYSSPVTWLNKNSMWSASDWQLLLDVWWAWTSASATSSFKQKVAKKNV